jgi:hypothetical protein
MPSVYLIFLFWDAFEFIAVYFAMVETKGLSLERTFCCAHELLVYKSLNFILFFRNRRGI